MYELVLFKDEVLLPQVVKPFNLSYNRCNNNNICKCFVTPQITTLISMVLFADRICINFHYSLLISDHTTFAVYTCVVLREFHTFTKLRNEKV